MSTPRALYNEVDKYAAQWLRNLIEAGLIAPGDVAECSIEDLTPNDLRPYNQVHFYAGIGVWSYALRSAGWNDARPVWTFSEPCQPFSAAGKRGGTSDERYLRPATHHLIRVCRPPVCFGEQVASKDGLGWLDTLQADMEGEGYAIGAFDTCSAGHGVEWEASQAGEWLRRAIHDCDDPWTKAQLGDFADFARGNFSEGGHHIRQRLRFVAERLQHTESDRRVEWRPEPGWRRAPGGCGPDGLADASDRERNGLAELRGSERDRANAGWSEGSGGAAARRNDGRLGDDDEGLEGQRNGHQAEIERDGAVRPVAEASKLGGVADADVIGRFGRRSGEAGVEPGAVERSERLLDAGRLADADGGQPRQAGPVQSSGQHGQQQEDRRTNAGRTGADARNSEGRYVDWLFCRDGKWRATRPGSLPLATNAASRVGRLRAYGNAVDAEATIQFIEAYLETEAERFRLTEVYRLSPSEDVFS